MTDFENGYLVERGVIGVTVARNSSNMYILWKEGLCTGLLSCGQGTFVGGPLTQGRKRAKDGNHEQNTSVDLDKSRLKDALIVSYSYSGNTHQIAKAIQTITGADWSEIYPWQPYPVEFPELLEQVQREVRNGYKPRLLPNAGLRSSMRLFFVGSPNWCGTIAPPLASWLSRHDLSGKVILPFYSIAGVLPEILRAISPLCAPKQMSERRLA